MSLVNLLVLCYTIFMNTRFCNRCGKEKSLDKFPHHKGMPLGRGYWCRECQSEYDGKRAKIPERILQVADWHHSEHGRGMSRIRRAERYALNKERYKAKEMIERLVNKGFIQRQPCTKCGNGNSQGHHPDYSKPLEIVWLCQAHHSEEHRLLRNSPDRKEKVMDLRDKIAQIQFCKQNCNALYSTCPHSKKASCHAVFLHEKQQNGWPFLLADEIISLLKTSGYLSPEELKEQGWVKLADTPAIADFSQACPHEEHTWDCEECLLKLLGKTTGERWNDGSERYSNVYH